MIEINNRILTEYAIGEIDNKTNVEDPLNLLIVEFTKNKQAAKNYRQFFERHWRIIDAYLWNDPSKIAKKPLKSTIFGSTNNVLFKAFNFKYSNLIANNVSEGISVTPSFIDKNVVDISNNAETVEKQNERDIDLTDYILKVKQFRDVLKFYWQDLNIDEKNKFIFWDYLVYGTGVAELHWDENNKNRHNDGELSLFYVPLFSFFLEPGVIEWQDSRYLIIAEEINLLNLQKVHNLTDTQIKEISNKVGVTNYSISQFINKDLIPNEYNKNIPYYRYYKKYLDKDNNIKISLNYFVGDANPYLVSSIDDIGIDQFPFEVLFSYKKPTESYGQSLFKFLIPAQRMILQQDAIIQQRALQSANPVIFISTGSNININEIAKDGLQIGKTYAVEGDPAKAAAVVKLNELPEDLVAYVTLLKNNINEMANINETVTGNRAVSGAGSNAVQQNVMNATMPFKIQQSEIQTYYQRVINLMMKFLISKQNEIRQIIIKNNISADVQYQAISYSIDEYEKLNKNLKITVKASSALDVEKERNLILELWKLTTQYPELQGAVTAIDVIRAFNLPNQEEMIANIQIQNDIDYNEIATQIVQIIQQNDQLAIQAQQQQAVLQSAQMSGEVSNEDIQKALKNVAQPLDPNTLVELVTNLIRMNPAKALENEKQIQASAMSAQEQNNANT